MAQPFSPRATFVARCALAGLAGAVILAGGVTYGVSRSGWFRDVGNAPPQPVPFSHLLHAGDLGVDCRFCHTTVERFALAGLPSTETCLTCHSGLPVGGAALAPVRAAFDMREPLLWNRVHRVPDHARFHHGVHVSAGFTCTDCHGEVETMPRVAKAETLSMTWCLDCHRTAPVSSPASTDGTGRHLEPLTDCSRCHR
ncbi:MAG TPA: cytochrome c3 family protein [Arenibaculum sp.]|nr:cytochrome c3 family protein [Arenibaculum sp.]